jgi:hypothetical protein
MLILGVVVSSGALSLLAHRLGLAGYDDLAQRIGSAVDGDRREMQVGRSDERAMLQVLMQCPASLMPLKRALRARRQPSVFETRSSGGIV